MTVAGVLISLFPLGVVAGAVACLVWFAVVPSLAPACALLAVLYLVPLLAFRFHQLVAPLRAGGSRIDGKTYVPWWGGHQIQLIYIAVPQLEALLRMVPGLYSLWLRGWGSRVGRRVHWTPLVEVTDRSLLEIGDGVVFGHRAVVFGHVIRHGKQSMLLYVRPVRIGDGVFIGAGSAIGPGAVIGAGARLDAETRVYPMQVVDPSEATDLRAPRPGRGVGQVREAHSGVAPATSPKKGGGKK
jgi:hypothetical protein